MAAPTTRATKSKKFIGIAPARVCAYTVLRRVFEDSSWADRVLHAEAKRLGLDGRDRALATQLAFGAVKRCATLDYLIEAFADRKLDKVAPPVLATLRLAIFQLVFLDRVPAHAAVSEAVALAKCDVPQAAGFVNAVLRRASREGAQRFAALDDATPQHAALRHSHPEWIAELFWDLFGADEARSLMAANNEPSETCVRVNTLRISVDAFKERIPVPSRVSPQVPEGLVLEAPFDAFGSPLWTGGFFMPQSRAAMAVAQCLDPQPGERVLDLCAAPGGKTTHIAALMKNEGEILAVEQNPARARALTEIAKRLGATIVDVKVADARLPQERTYDRVLVDPPCSDLGTLRARPDLRWRKGADLPTKLAVLQTEILQAGAAALKPGGHLVYSTCTLTPRENEAVIEAFLASQAEFELDDLQSEFGFWQHPVLPQCIQTLPHRDGTDGFFIARLRKTK